jgi:hypothetical protein
VGICCRHFYVNDWLACWNFGDDDYSYFKAIRYKIV